MAWRERLKVSPSRAELEIRIELQCRRIILSHEEAILFYLSEAKVFRKNMVTRKMVAEAEGFTVPDGRHEKLIFYFDGPVHKRKGVQQRDERIDAMLIKHGFKPCRFPFEVRSCGISVCRKKEICDEIQRLVGERSE